MMVQKMMFRNSRGENSQVPAVSLLGCHFVIGPDPIRPLIIRGHRLVPSECCRKTWRKNRCQGQATLEFDAAKFNKSKVERMPARMVWCAWIFIGSGSLEIL